MGIDRVAVSGGDRIEVGGSVRCHVVGNLGVHETKRLKDGWIQRKRHKQAIVRKLSLFILIFKMVDVTRIKIPGDFFTCIWAHHQWPCRGGGWQACVGWWGCSGIAGGVRGVVQGRIRGIAQRLPRDTFGV